MKKYLKIKNVLEAIQIEPGVSNLDELREFCTNGTILLVNDGIVLHTRTSMDMFQPVLEISGQVGDWLIKNGGGNFDIKSTEYIETNFDSYLTDPIRPDQMQAAIKTVDTYLSRLEDLSNDPNKYDELKTCLTDFRRIVDVLINTY